MPDAPPRTLSADQFGDAFTAAGRALWCIAVGVLGRREGAEDVLQEAAVVALGKLGDFDADTSFNAWMGQIVRFVALNHARRRQRSPLAGVEPDALAALATAGRSAESPPVDGVGTLATDQYAFDDGVVAALESLEPTARATLLLRVVTDMPYREIARVLDMPEGTAMSHVHRSRKAMFASLTSSATGSTTGSATSAGSPTSEVPS